VYALLGRPQSAIYHGERSLHISKASALAPFYHSYAHEAIARGHLAAGELAKVREHKGLAEAFVPQIEDPEELEFIQRDLGTLA
jgi:hypothetical protein